MSWLGVEKFGNDLVSKVNGLNGESIKQVYDNLYRCVLFFNRYERCYAVNWKILDARDIKDGLNNPNDGFLDDGGKAFLTIRRFIDESDFNRMIKPENNELKKVCAIFALYEPNPSLELQRDDDGLIHVVANAKDDRSYARVCRQ